MKRPTMHKRTARRLLASVSVGALMMCGGLYSCTPARAQGLDPHIPVPVLTWCPGGGAGGPLGGYCEGVSFPDGTRLNSFHGPGFWVGPRCIRPNGTATPPLAPGGCRGIG